jgi:hypothetical protein
VLCVPICRHLPNTYICISSGKSQFSNPTQITLHERIKYSCITISEKMTIYYYWQRNVFTANSLMNSFQRLIYSCGGMYKHRYKSWPYIIQNMFNHLKPSGSYIYHGLTLRNSAVWCIAYSCISRSMSWACCTSPWRDRDTDLHKAQKKNPCAISGDLYGHSSGPLTCSPVRTKWIQAWPHLLWKYGLAS